MDNERFRLNRSSAYVSAQCARGVLSPFMVATLAAVFCTLRMVVAAEEHKAEATDPTPLTAVDAVFPALDLFYARTEGGVVAASNCLNYSLDLAALPKAGGFRCSPRIPFKLRRPLCDGLSKGSE